MTHDWVVWCKSKKGAEEILSFELSGKEIFSNYDETKSMRITLQARCTKISLSRQNKFGRC